MELIHLSFWVICSFFVCVFHFKQCDGFFLSYVAFFSSLKFNEFTGYSFPGLYSMSYDKSDTILLHEKRITGEIVPFLSNYGFCELPYPPIGSLEMFTLGERFSPYEISMADNVTCKHLCTKTFVGGDIQSKEQLDALRKGMDLKFKRHWVIDHNIPALWCPELDFITINGNFSKNVCESGFPIGCYTGTYENGEFCSTFYDKFSFSNLSLNIYDSYFIFNHVDFIITYEGSPYNSTKSRLVNVKVVPSSINHTDNSYCSSENPLEIPKGDIPLGKSLDIKYTYSIMFIRNDSMKWSSRWDYIFRSMPFSNLHWIPLIHSILAVMFVVLIPVTVIKAMYKDSISYMMMESGETVEPKMRWKLITHGDVHSAVKVSLSILLGSVVQLICMAISALGFSLLAYHQSENRDLQMLLELSIFILLGTVGGYYTSSFYKQFGGENWKTVILISSICCSGIAVTVFFVLDCVLFYIDSSSSLPIYSLSAFLGVIYMFLVPFTAAGFMLDFHS